MKLETSLRSLHAAGLGIKLKVFGLQIIYLSQCGGETLVKHLHTFPDVFVSASLSTHRTRQILDCWSISILAEMKNKKMHSGEGLIY